MLRRKSGKNVKATEDNDLKYYGKRIIDNTITDEELQKLFLKYNRLAGDELNVIVNGFQKYLDATQLFKLCVRLMPLEVKFNGDGEQFMRNKSLTKCCMYALMDKLQFGTDLLDLFNQNGPASFLESNLEIPPFLAYLFKIVFNLMPETSQETQGEMFVFNVVKTSMVTASNQLEPRAALACISAVNDAMKKKSPAFVNFVAQIHHTIMNSEVDLATLPTPSAREFANNAGRFINEIDGYSERDAKVQMSWPTVFSHIQRTEEQNNAIQRARCLNIFAGFRDAVNNQQELTPTTLVRIVFDTNAMFDAIKRNHPDWIATDMINLVFNILMLANQAAKETIPDKDTSTRVQLAIAEGMTALSNIPTNTIHNSYRK